MTAAPIPTPKAETAMDKLQRFLEERRKAAKPATSFEQFEEDLHRVVAEMECEAVGEELGRQTSRQPR